MPTLVEPNSGLEFTELSHVWGTDAPIWPGGESVRIEYLVYHAKMGSMTQKITSGFQTGTHINAPIHLVAGGKAVGELPLEHFFGNGVIVDVRKDKWGLITPDDLEKAKPEIQAGDIVILVTGWHKRYADSQEYFGHAPGLSKAAAQWLVNKKVKLVGIDTAAIDHPLATSLGPHRNGPQMRYLARDYQKATGRDPLEDHPEWNAAHLCLLEAGIPTVENVGGDVADVLGVRCTIQGFPWKWKKGDACVTRLMAIRDPKQNYRLEKSSLPVKQSGLKFFDLSHEWGHGMNQWPGALPNLPSVSIREFHAKNGVFSQKAEFHMHRGTHMDAPLHVLENTPDILGYDIWRFFGTGVVVSIPKGRWGVVTPEDLENATPKIQPNDVVIINTGSHRDWGDDPKYWVYGPGLYKEAGEWLVKKGVKLVGIDVQALDHPMGTYLVPHGSGPTMPHLMDEYKAETGRDVMSDFPYWEPAHKVMMGNGIPGIENVGGEIDAITGQRCTFLAFPWRWKNGDGCSLRLVAVIDPEQKFRING